MTLEYRFMRGSARIAAVLVLAGCSSEDDRPDYYVPPGSTIPGERLPPRTEAFEEAPCWFPKPRARAVECGFLNVPEDRSLPSSRSIRLAVAMAYSSLAAPPADPVVYLEGGPGASPIEVFTRGLFDHILDERDLILLDQRGTGHSEPALDCPELEQGGASDPLQALRSCSERFRMQGVALEAYDTAANAADVEELRVALGYPAWNVYGISYGTRLGLTVLRDHPAGVRSLIVDGVLPLEVDLFVDGAANAERSFSLVFDACAAQASCAAAFPNLRDGFLALIDELDQFPIPLSLDDGTEILLRGSAVVRVLFLVLYSAEALAFVPSVIGSALAGDYEFFRRVLSDIGESSSVSYGMYYSVMCADEVAFATPEQMAGAAASVHPVFAKTFATPAIFEECGTWNVAASPALENEPVSSDVSSLVSSGDFDPVTPPRYGDLVAAQLERALSFTLADQAHGASVGACGARLVTGFLDRPSGGFDASCADALSRPDFRTAALRRLPPIDFVTSRTLPLGWLAERALQAARRRPADWLSLRRAR